ncbi:hypothetical protein GBAR_LOCUS10201 [Geodia barretti]|uniref:Uncharacterized protein n=1 Tax=Geodia barretti TaxID=519541 RepID=A0AA35WCT5_GEOBA|nr:hypothetical protein GBAR_LOCUS10201 [Geodia barretti]
MPYWFLTLGRTTHRSHGSALL